jgi:hypothetical protein
MPLSMKLSKTPHVNTPRMPPPSRIKAVFDVICTDFLFIFIQNVAKIGFVYNIFAIFGADFKFLKQIYLSK